MKINKKLDSFIYSISHNVSNPLSTLSGLLNLAERKSTENNQQVKEFHHIMKTCLKRLDTTIRQMVDQSKNARLDVETNTIDIGALLDKSMNSLSYLDAASSIDTTIINTAQVPFYSDPY